MGSAYSNTAFDHQVVSALINERTAYARLGLVSPPFRTIIGGGASLAARDRTTASATARRSEADSSGACVG